MTEALLITHKTDIRNLLTLPGHMGDSFPVRVVKGIGFSGSKSMVAPGNRWKRLREESIMLTDEKAGRLGEFVSRVIVDQESLYRNGITFAAFMHTGSPLNNDHRPIRFDLETGREVLPHSLASGDSYLAFTAAQQPVQGLVGTDNPTEHLAVWGEKAPLAVGDNMAMLGTYQAAHIYRTEGRFNITPA